MNTNDWHAHSWAAPHFKSHPGDSSLFHDLFACIINSIVDDRVWFSSICIFCIVLTQPSRKLNECSCNKWRSGWNRASVPPSMIWEPVWWRNYSVSLLVGGEKEGVCFCVTHGCLFLSQWVIWEPDTICLRQTCQVLTQEQQDHKSVQHPSGYLGNTWSQPGGEHCREDSGQCPRPLSDNPAEASHSLVWNQCPVPCKGQDGPQPRGPEKHKNPATKHSKRQRDQLGGELRGQLWVPREVELRQKSEQLDSGPALQSFIFTQTARADRPSTLCGYGD